jgi:hypothetical protein
MTPENASQTAIIGDTMRRHRMAARRLAMVNFALSKHGPDAALAAECEGLTVQIADLEAKLKMLKGEAAD